MTQFKGRVAAVTGAGSGIGRALALELARRGARLALSDRDADAVAATAATAQTFGAEVHHEQLDVTDRDAFERHAAAVVDRYGTVNQIYNNAGIAFSRTVLESDYADYERVLAVNLWGVIHGTKAFLPHLIASADGHVINISSLNGFMAQTDMSHYCASKFAVRGFTETLRMEMLAAGHPVRVTSVHPGGVQTNIATSALEDARALGHPVTKQDENRKRLYNEKLLRMPADKAAEIILNGVAKQRPRVLVGNDAKTVDLLVRTLPGRYQQIVATLANQVAASSPAA